MSLLSMIKQVCGELNLAIPPAVITSTDTTVRQLLAMANREGVQLSKRNPWSAIDIIYSFPLVADQESYELPTNYDRIVNRTQWDKSMHWPLLGPMSAQEYEWRMNGITISTPRRRWRIMGRNILINPIPEAGDAGKIMVFEYISADWCQSAAGVTQSTWVADTDTGILSENLMGMGIKWRFLKAKGLNYDEEFREYAASCDMQFASEAGAPALNISNRAQIVVGLTPANIQESGFGQ